MISSSYRSLSKYALGTCCFVILILFYGCKSKAKDLLSVEEREWINQLDRELIHAPDPSSPPMEFYDSDSIFQGITADYLAIISERLNIKIKTVRVKNWSEVVEKGIKREIDFSTAVQKTTPRKDFWNFTSPFFSVRNVIIVKNKEQLDLNIEDLSNKKVAIVKDYAAAEFVQQNYPNINYHIVPNIAEAIKLVSFSEVDAGILDLPSAAYHTQQLGLTDLKVVGDINYPYNFTYASRNDWPILNQILQKGLNSISSREKQKIHNRWISLNLVPIWQTSSFWYSILALAILFSLLIWLVIFLRKKNRALKIATEQAHAANAAKSEFLANMSHEIRTPMNAIIGFTEILSEMEQNKKQKEFLDIISKSGESLLNLINDILDLSKIEAGKISYQPEKTSLKALLNEIEAFFSLKIQLKELDFIIENKDIDLVLVDGLRMKQVLINLVGNAVKFTSEGFIKISVHSSVESVQECTKNISITIEDTGIGIPEDQLTYIFEAFSQGKNIDNISHGGTGLGLAITNRLMEIMDGSVSCKNKEDKGAIFTLTFRNVKTLPDKVTGAELSQKQGQNIHFKKASILVVDDTPSSRRLIQEYLNSYGFEINIATNGIEALEIMSNKMPDLVITDIKMTDVDGFELLNRIKQLNYYKKIPVIAVSASIMGNVEKSISEAGFDNFIRKPIKKNELIDVLRKHIGDQ